MGNGNMTMQILGFSGALLHTLNHSLFKSLLFFSAGNIYQQTHTRNMERLGGLIKKMPKTALFFLIGSVAIGGIPPFNGFVSEFVIYSGIFKGLLDSQGILQAVMLISTIAGLAIVGGMSLLTFTKTFGVVFLGNPREQLSHEPHESSFIMLFPQYLIVAVMLSIAVFPQFYFQHACDIVRTSFSIDGPSAQVLQNTALNISGIGKVSLIFIVLLLAILGIRRVLTRKRTSYELDTWGCGYVAPIPKAQYSGRSYIRSFGMLFNFLVKEEKSGSKIPKEKLYPGKFNIVIWYTDILEKYFVVPSAKRLTFILNYFQFIQNGQIQSYVLYGLFFVILVFLGSMMNFIY
jgi:NADH:ubiquinone oxidoreductase subunit 5 (subunit L)/multisubunit Na+/H+ antiporter MnhA subunit